MSMIVSQTIRIISTKSEKEKTKLYLFDFLIYLQTPQHKYRSIDTSNMENN